jgi:hypothetical protein
MVARVDVRIDLNIPGKLEVYAVSETNTKAKVNEKEWLRAHVSSVLRSFYPQAVTAARILPVLPTPRQYQEFIQAAFTVMKNGKRIILETSRLSVWEGDGRDQVESELPRGSDHRVFDLAFPHR